MVSTQAGAMVSTQASAMVSTQAGAMVQPNVINILVIIILLHYRINSSKRYGAA